MPLKFLCSNCQYFYCKTMVKHGVKSEIRLCYNGIQIKQKVHTSMHFIIGFNNGTLMFGVQSGFFLCLTRFILH